MKKLDIVTTIKGDNQYTFRIFDIDQKEGEVYDFVFGSYTRFFKDEISMCDNITNVRLATEVEVIDYLKRNRLTDKYLKYYNVLLDIMFNGLYGDNPIPKRSIENIDKLFYNVIDNKLTDEEIRESHSYLDLEIIFDDIISNMNQSSEIFEEVSGFLASILKARTRYDFEKLKSYTLGTNDKTIEAVTLLRRLKRESGKTKKDN